ncbi:hypothetical protein ES702_07275 [subsurface metagenome]
MVARVLLPPRGPQSAENATLNGFVGSIGRLILVSK